MIGVSGKGGNMKWQVTVGQFQFETVMRNVPFDWIPEKGKVTGFAAESMMHI